MNDVFCAVHLILANERILNSPIIPASQVTKRSLVHRYVVNQNHVVYSAYVPQTKKRSAAVCICICTTATPTTDKVVEVNLIANKGNQSFFQSKKKKKKFFQKKKKKKKKK